MLRKLITVIVLLAIALFPLQGIRAAVSADHAKTAMQGMDCECPPERGDCDHGAGGCLLDPACMLRCIPAPTSVGSASFAFIAPVGVVLQVRETYDGRPSRVTSPPFRPPNPSILI